MRTGVLAACLLAVGIAACGNGDEVQGVPPKAPAAHEAMALHDNLRSAARASDLGPASNAEQLLNFAEVGPYSSTFWPHSFTQGWGPFRYRYYPRIGAYLGVAVSPDPNYRFGGVYVMGGKFGSQPAYVGQLTEFITPVADPPSVGGEISLSPGVLSANFDEGTSPFLQVSATSSVELGSSVFVVVEDPAQVLHSVGPVEILESGIVTARVNVGTGLSRGAHRGTFIVHICKTADCSSEYPSSPISLPYRFGVVRKDPRFRYAAVGSMLSPVLRQGDTARFVIQATGDRWPSQPVYFKAFDPEGRVSGSVAIQPSWSHFDNSAQDLEFSVDAPAEGGVYRGRFQIVACRDLECREEMVESRGQLDYVITRDILLDASIGALSKLSPLQPLPGAGDWSAPQGNAAHTGYVPGVFDISKFSLRWEWSLPRGSESKWRRLQAPGITRGSIALAVDDLNVLGVSELLVLDESDGAVRWRKRSDHWSQSFRDPVVSSTRVFAVLDNPGDNAIQAFDSQTGAQMWETKPGGNTTLSTPVLSGGSLFMSRPGDNRGAVSFDALTGAPRWQAATGLSDGGWIPAVAGTRVYEYFRGRLWAHDAASGSELFSARDPESDYRSNEGYKSMSIADNRLFVVNGDLVAHEATNGRVAWRQGGRSYVRNTAVHDNALIALKFGPVIEARNPVDGRLIWSVEPRFKLAPTGSTFVSDPVLTDNLVFVSTSEGVFAISRSTGKLLWFYGKSGWLSVSPNGVLTISDLRTVHEGGGSVTAINLR